MANKKRKILNKAKTRNSKYSNLQTMSTGKKLGALALAVLLGLSTASFAMHHFGKKEVYTIGQAKDLDGDPFEDSIPIYQDGQIVGTVSDGEYIIINGKPAKDDTLVSIATINDKGELITGETKSTYIKKLEEISEEQMQKYNAIYTVKPDTGVNIRSSAKIEEDNKIASALQGTKVLGSTVLLPEDNRFMWVPVLYVTENDFIEGYIRSDLLEKDGEIEFNEEQPEIQEKPEQEGRKIKLVVDTSKDGGVPLKLRNSKERNPENIICGIPDGSIVYAKGNKTEENNSIEWRKVEYTDKNGETFEGWVADGYLTKYKEIEKVVDTSGTKVKHLNVREAPTTKSSKIAEIEHGTKLKISEQELENTVESDGHEWVKIELPDGTEGYVSCKYLKDPEKEKLKPRSKPKSDIAKEILSNTYVSRSGNVAGIDVANGVSPEDLRKLLKNDNAIPAKYKDIAGKANFVYIKIAASGYGKTFSIIPNDNYKAQAEVCEELGVPYGFYYYSTSTTKEEAKKEARFIENALDSLDTTDYNLLPLTIDVELASGKQDRQYGIDVTAPKAYLANTLEPKYGKTMLYGGGRSLSDNSSERILNLKEYNKQLTSGNTHVWLAVPRSSDEGGIGPVTAGYKSSIEQHSKVAIEQTLLDVDLDLDGKKNTKKTTHVDIDMMDSNVFELLIDKKYEEIVSIGRGTAKTLPDNSMTI